MTESNPNDKTNTIRNTMQYSPKNNKIESDYIQAVKKRVKLSASAINLDELKNREDPNKKNNLTISNESPNNASHFEYSNGSNKIFLNKMLYSTSCAKFYIILIALTISILIFSIISHIKKIDEDITVCIELGFFIILLFEFIVKIWIVVS